ncbi:cold-shock protein [Halomonas sp. AOP43-A1-21]|uniref:cold-shock protein n=1 Tax=Halomonas sp. TaxID=1486246 RepID=UPI003F901F0D
MAYSAQKKYGFITGKDGASYFFHRNHLKQPNASPKKGLSVRFDPVPTPKGMAARQIEVNDKALSYWVYHTPEDFITSKALSVVVITRSLPKAGVFLMQPKAL